MLLSFVSWTKFLTLRLRQTSVARPLLVSGECRRDQPGRRRQVAQDPGQCATTTRNRIDPGFIIVYTSEYTHTGCAAMTTAIAKVFTSGNSQAIRLPKEFRLDADEVFIYRSGDNLILTPRMHSWDGFIEGLSGFSDDFAMIGGVTKDRPGNALI